jgi:hypothetical protein
MPDNLHRHVRLAAQDVLNIHRPSIRAVRHTRATRADHDGSAADRHRAEVVLRRAASGSQVVGKEPVSVHRMEHNGAPLIDAPVYIGSHGTDHYRIATDRNTSSHHGSAETP